MPYEKILSLFRQANIDRPGKPYYRSIMAGIAPGGAVSVWVNGAKTTEVFFGQAEKYDMLPFPTFGVPIKSKEQSDEYIADVLKDVLKPEELESLKKNGIPFGAWARYRKFYKWIPIYKNAAKTKKDEMQVDYINGETNWAPTHLSDDQENISRALPRHIEISIASVEGYNFYIIDFDEFELMDAFERLGSNGEKVHMEFDPQTPRQLMRIRVYNDKESIDLKKIYIKP